LEPPDHVVMALALTVTDVVGVDSIQDIEVGLIKLDT